MTAARKASATFAIAMAGIVIAGIGAYVSVQRLLDAKQWQEHTDQVLGKLDHTLSDLNAAEGEARGYMLSGEEEFLEPYNNTVGSIQSDISALGQLTQDNPTQQENLKKVRELTDAKLAILGRSIGLRRKSGLEAAAAEVRTQHGKTIMDDLRRLLDNMKNVEQKLLDARTQSADLSAHRTLMLLAVWVPLSLLLLAMAALYVLGTMRFEGPAAPEGPSGRTWRLTAIRYGLAPVTVVIATALFWWLRRTFGPLPLFLTYYPAVLLVAVIAGGGPGVLATMLSALAADLFFIDPIGSLGVAHASDLIALAVFTGTNLFLCAVSERLRRARRSEAIAQQKEMLAVTLASIGDGVIVTDVEGCVTFINNAAEKLIGWKLAEVAGKPLSGVLKLINDVNRQPVENLVDTVLRTGSLLGMADHTILIARDGREIPIDQSCALVRSGAGEVNGVVISFRDFTQRKQAQDQLQLHLAVLQSAANAIVITGPEGTIRWVNPAFTRLTGYEAAEAIGKNPRILKSGRQDDAFYAHLWRTIKSGKVWQGELVNRRKDGSFYHEDMTITPVRNAAGKIAHFVAIKQDVTDRMRAEEAQVRLAAIVESSDDAILSKSLDGTITSWNAGAQRLLGYEAWEIIGQAVTRLLPPDRVDEIKQILARISKGERIEQFETLRMAKDGRLIDVLLTVSPVLDRHGHVVGASTIAHDITARKEAEEVLKRSAENLARSNEDLAQFAYVASHDLLEPLRMVSGYLSLIEQRYKDKLDQDASEFIGFAVDGAVRMNRLITDLLDYSRINTGGKRPESVDMESVLKRALENLQAAIRESNAQITHEALPTVQGDPSQLVQLLQNLVGNAIKFRAPDRPVKVCIGAKMVDDEWVFGVKDEGIGIDPQYAQKIFLIFQRLHSRSEYPGTGIGLAICKKIVERHGGRIWVESQLGQGSTFYFTINHVAARR